MESKKDTIRGAGYDGPANAIIAQAADDYIESYKRLVRLKNREREQEAMIDNCRDFFLGEWITALTDVDGDYILKKLDEKKTIRRAPRKETKKKDGYWNTGSDPGRDGVYLIACMYDKQPFVWMSQYALRKTAVGSVRGSWPDKPHGCKIVGWAPLPSVDCFKEVKEDVVPDVRE